MHFRYCLFMLLTLLMDACENATSPEIAAPTAQTAAAVQPTPTAAPAPATFTPSATRTLTAVPISIALPSLAAPPFGSEQHVIYPGPASWASWAPEGDRLIFFRDTAPGEAEIHVTDSHGAVISEIAKTSGVRTSLVRYGQSLLSYPIWSPDGKQIPFTVTGTAGRNELWVASADGSAKMKIADAGPLWHLTWLVDGRIVFLRAGAVYSINPEGQNQQLISSVYVDPLTFNLSPDGTKFVHKIGDKLMLMDIDGRNPKLLGAAIGGESAWSRDGKYVAYLLGDKSGFEALWVSDRDGNHPLMISSEQIMTGWVGALSWSANDQWLAFNYMPTGAGTAGEMAIYLVKPGGGGPYQLVMHGVYGPLTWSPDKTQFAYTRYSTPDSLPLTNLELVVANLQY